MARTSYTSDALPVRTRGAKGRTEAALRGVITGNGPQGSILNPGKNVVLWGFPGKMREDGVEDLLKSWRLAWSAGVLEVVKMERVEQQFTLVSRFLVRLASASEAHRLVRLLHMTYHEPETRGQKYQVRARVIY